MSSLVHIFQPSSEMIFLFRKYLSLNIHQSESVNCASTKSFGVWSWKLNVLWKLFSIAREVWSNGRQKCFQYFCVQLIFKHDKIIKVIIVIAITIMMVLIISPRCLYLPSLLVCGSKITLFVNVTGAPPMYSGADQSCRHRFTVFTTFWQWRSVVTSSGSRWQCPSHHTAPPVMDEVDWTMFLPLTGQHPNAALLEATHPPWVARTPAPSHSAERNGQQDS